MTNYEVGMFLEKCNFLKKTQNSLFSPKMALFQSRKAAEKKGNVKLYLVDDLFHIDNYNTLLRCRHGVSNDYVHWETSLQKLVPDPQELLKDQALK